MPQYLTTMLGCFCSVIAAVFIYASSPNQQWFQQRVIEVKRGAWLATILSLFAVGLFYLNYSLLPALFTTLTLLMLTLSTLPLLVRLPKPLTNQLRVKPWLKRGESYQSHQSQWWLKSVGMLLIGFPWAVLVSGFLGFSIGDYAPDDVRTQFVMWMITPIWLVPISLIYFSQKPWRTLAVFAVSTPVFYALLEWVK